MAERSYTRWSVVGAGEAGCRVAAHYFASYNNPAIESRILLLNTAKADLTNLLKTLEKDLRGEEAKARLEIATKQSFSVGSTGGAGNFWLNGERALEDGWDEVERYIGATIGGAADVMVHVCGLGGGTGNGFVPAMTHRLKSGKARDVRDGVYQFSVGIWPFPEEGEQRIMNAVSGLSRLLRGPEGRPNADLVLLLDNKLVGKLAAERTAQAGGRLANINTVIVEVLNALISPGQESAAVIDARDYAINKQRYQMPYMTAGVAWEVPDILTLDEALNDAVEHLLFPVDPKTSLFAYLILQVPPDAVHAPAFELDEVASGFKRWLSAQGIHAHTRMESVVPNRNLQGTYHAILFLGGFDLVPLVEQYKAQAERQIAALKARKFGADPAEAAAVETNWQRLVEYAEVSNEQRRLLQG